ncbi:MAG: hypothetical protein ACLQU5_28835 [Isosphaeraceae bacterium]
MARATAIVAHADPLPAATPAEQMLRSDLLRSAWMFSVGALDAYFCDRPKVAPQPLVKGGTVIKVIEDVEFLVNRCDEHINGEFRQFLLDCGCPPAIGAQAAY